MRGGKAAASGVPQFGAGGVAGTEQYVQNCWDTVQNSKKQEKQDKKDKKEARQREKKENLEHVQQFENEVKGRKEQAEKAAEETRARQAKEFETLTARRRAADERQRKRAGDGEMNGMNAKRRAENVDVDPNLEDELRDGGDEGDERSVPRRVPGSSGRAARVEAHNEKFVVDDEGNYLGRHLGEDGNESKRRKRTLVSEDDEEDADVTTGGEWRGE